MSAVGIIIAKENSIRFPGKNYFTVNGKPMFYHNVELLKNCKEIEDVFVCTDSPYIRKYCVENNVRVIFRGQNVSHDEQPFLDVLKFAYQSIFNRFDYIVSILANTIGHTQESLDSAVSLAVENDISDLRSFDDTGKESGIIILKESVILNNASISAHMGAVTSNGKEIHYKEELNECN